VSHFNICSNIDNGVGLQKDAELLRDLLQEWGHTAKLVHYKKQGDIEEAPRARANIFLEVVAYNLVARRIADQNWLIPNPEWFASWDHQNAIQTFDKFLCKTHDAVKIMQRELKEYRNKVQYIGFESRDLYDPSIPRERRFLHLAGMSQFKNTQATVYAFTKVTIDDEARPPLTIVSVYPELWAFGKDCKNVTAYQRVSDEEIKRLMNSHQFHILPSGYEGWGHALWEGLGCGAVMMTTDHPPMNEFDGIARNLLIAYQDTIPELSAQRARVVAGPILGAIQRALKMSPREIAATSAHAREAFLATKAEFRKNFQLLVNQL
jgi:hypothetical protein